MPSGCIRIPKSGKPEVLRDFLRRAFVALCDGCDIQHKDGEGIIGGWPCRTCFFWVMDQLGIKGNEAHAMWLIQLRLRNDGSHDDDMYMVEVVKLPKALGHEARVRAHQGSMTEHDKGRIEGALAFWKRMAAIDTICVPSVDSVLNLPNGTTSQYLKEKGGE